MHQKNLLCSWESWSMIHPCSVREGSWRECKIKIPLRKAPVPWRKRAWASQIHRSWKSSSATHREWGRALCSTRNAPQSFRVFWKYNYSNNSRRRKCWMGTNRNLLLGWRNYTHTSPSFLHLLSTEGACTSLSWNSSKISPISMTCC